MKVIWETVLPLVGLAALVIAAAVGLRGLRNRRERDKRASIRCAELDQLMLVYREIIEIMSAHPDLTTSRAPLPRYVHCAIFFANVDPQDMIHIICVQIEYAGEVQSICFEYNTVEALAVIRSILDQPALAQHRQAILVQYNGTWLHPRLASDPVNHTEP